MQGITAWHLQLLFLAACIECSDSLTLVRLLCLLAWARQASVREWQ
jgi:hypothetical protein